MRKADDFCCDWHIKGLCGKTLITSLQVKYDGRGMLERNRDRLSRNLVECLASSSDDLVKALFTVPCSKNGSLSRYWYSYSSCADPKKTIAKGGSGWSLQYFLSFILSCFNLLLFINVFHRGSYGPPSRSSWNPGVQLLLEVVCTSILRKPIIATCNIKN